MTGSSGSGDDIEAGRTNFAESTTVVQGGRPSELDVSFNGLAVFEAGPRRDDQRPDGTVSGVLGRGWNGPLNREPGAGVIGVGAPNRGPGLVGLGGGQQIGETFLGSPGNLGATGLGGTGVIGMGGDGAANADGGPDVAVDIPTLPGVGVVGQGGTAFFATPVAGSPDPGTGNGAGLVGIAGSLAGLLGGMPDANLSQADLAATANVGVVGFGGNGPQSVSSGASASFVGPQSAGAGVRGVGGVAATPGTALRRGGPGVVGVAGDVAVPGDAALAESGVAGIAQRGVGVAGRSAEQAGVQGSSTTGPGVRGGSDAGVGVVGDSSSAVGGYFSSAAVAQLHLEPHREPLAAPGGRLPGRAGDLLVLLTPREEQNATLWFCRTTGDATSAVWVQLA